MNTDEAIALAARKGLRVYTVGQLDDGSWRACVIDSRRNSETGEAASASQAVEAAIAGFFARHVAVAPASKRDIFA